MTCVVGVVDDGLVWMGADSAGASGWSLQIRSDAKVFRRGPFLMGFTTSFRMGQLLRWSLDADDPADGNLEEFMATAFVDAVRKCLKDGGFAKKESEREEGGRLPRRRPWPAVHGPQRLPGVRADRAVRRCWLRRRRGARGHVRHRSPRARAPPAGSPRCSGAALSWCARSVHRASGDRLMWSSTLYAPLDLRRCGIGSYTDVVLRGAPGGGRAD